MQIGERLKQFARAFPGGIESLAEQSGWPPHQLYAVLHDREEPSLALLQALARAGCDLNWLLLGEPEFSRTRPSRAANRPVLEPEEAAQRLQAMAEAMEQTLDQPVLKAEFEGGGAGSNVTKKTAAAAGTQAQADNSSAAAPPNVLRLPTDANTAAANPAGAAARAAAEEQDGDVPKAPRNTDVEMLPFDALSPKAIRSLNINIKPTEK